MPFEVEQKFHVPDRATLIENLQREGWRLDHQETNRDAYYNHPCKDFAQTGEAFRIRQIDGVGHLTYKGPKLSGSIKAREELEWSLGEDDRDGTRTMELLQKLDFRPVAVVQKVRLVYRDASNPGLTVVVDQVESVGSFAEIETVIDGPDEVKKARKRVTDAAAKLGLDRAESRSYLTMLLTNTAPPR